MIYQTPKSKIQSKTTWTVSVWFTRIQMLFFFCLNCFYHPNWSIGLSQEDAYLGPKGFEIGFYISVLIYCSLTWGFPNYGCLLCLLEVQAIQHIWVFLFGIFIYHLLLIFCFLNGITCIIHLFMSICNITFTLLFKDWLCFKPSVIFRIFLVFRPEQVHTIGISLRFSLFAT